MVVLTCLYPARENDVDDKDSDVISDIGIEPSPNRPLIAGSLALTLLSALFALLNAMWQHTSTATAATLAETVAQGNVEAHVGRAAAALAWVGFAMLVLASLGFVATIASLAALDELDDDSDTSSFV